MAKLYCDFPRYPNPKGALRAWLFMFRACQKYPTNYFFRLILGIISRMRFIEISSKTRIGEGLYIGHFYGITINASAILGKNINIHKGVTIGQENRGKRKGSPVIGDFVWIGINSTIVGNVRIGNNLSFRTFIWLLLSTPKCKKLHFFPFCHK